MPLINWENNFVSPWCDKFVLYNNTKATTFEITDTNFYVPIVSLSTQGNTKLIEQLKLRFKLIETNTKLNFHQKD